MPDIVQRRLTGAWLDWIYSLQPILAEFASADQEEVRARFKDLDKNSRMLRSMRLEVGSSIVTLAATRRQ